MSKNRRFAHIGLIAMTLTGIIAFLSLLSIPAQRAEAATIFITNTARVSFMDNLGETYPIVNDTAILRVLNPPIFRNFAKTGDPFSPNGDGRADTVYLSYTLYDHDYSSDTVGLYIYSGSDTVKTLVADTAQNTGYYIYAWDGTSDTGSALADGIYDYLLRAVNDDCNTATIGGTITLDITPPAGSVFINNDAIYANTYTVLVSLNAVDNLTGVNTVVISNTSDFSVQSDSKAYFGVYQWDLSNDSETTDTIKQVYVKYIDRVWNTSVVYSDTIIFDAFPPEVLSTSPYAGETDVLDTATITAVFNDVMNTSTLNTSTFVLRSIGGETVNGAFSSSVYADTTSITFDPAYLRSGETYVVTITAGVKDKAGNSMIADKVWSFRMFKYDTTPPTGTVLIDSGALYANTDTAYLSLKAYDDRSPVTLMRVSNFPIFGMGTEFPYNETLTWALSAGDGLKTVYVWYYDDAGNWQFYPCSDTITLDLTVPSILWTSPAESEVEVFISTDVRIAFDDLLDTATINTSTFKLNNYLGDTIAAVITYQAFTDTSIVTMTPVLQLVSYDTYIVTVTTDVTDKAGHQLAAGKVWWFVTGDVMAPAVVEGLRVTAISPTESRINWRAVTLNMDGSAYTDSGRYVILRGTVSGGPYTKLGEASSSETTYADTTIVAGSTYYYIVRAEDSSGNSSPYWVEATNSGDIIVRIPRDNSETVTNPIVISMGGESISIGQPDINDNLTNIRIPAAAASVLYENSGQFNDDMGIIIRRNATEEGGTTRNLGIIVSCDEIDAYKVTTRNLVSEMNFSVEIAVTMHYEVENGFIKHTNIPAALAGNNLSVAYWNGIQWVRLGGVVDKAKQTVSVTTSHLSKFAITAIDVSKFTVLSAEPNPFTPYRAPFDKVTFSFVNPSNERVILKIYDLTGTMVYEYSQNAVNSLEWNGTDRSGRIAEDGAYIYQVQIGDKAYTGTVILAK